MFSPGSLVYCSFLHGIYRPMGVILRKVNIEEYEVYVMHKYPQPQIIQSIYLELVNENR